MGILIQYLLHFSVPLLVYFTDISYVWAIPWIGSIAFSLLFRGRKGFFLKKPQFELVLGIIAIVISITIVTFLHYHPTVKVYLSPGSLEYYFLELWKLTPLFFMIHHPFIFGKNAKNY